MMSVFIILVVFPLLSSGVFGDVVVTVMEGDSVTLHADTKIQIIDWRSGENVIASIDTETGDSSLNGASKDKLKLDNQTGDLEITNIKISDAGSYNLHVNVEESPSKKFTVNVVPVNQRPSVLSAVGECVTLNTSVFEPKIYDVIRWRFGDQKSPIVEVNRVTGDVPKYDNVSDGRFRDRLQLDYWTGSLTITHTKPTDSGEYEVDIISNSKYTIHKSFSVTVRDPGLSEGAKAAIGVVVLLGFAALAGVVFYQYRKISELEKQAGPPIVPTTEDPTTESNGVGEGSDEVRTVSLIQGEPITLNPDGEHQDDTLVWSFKGFCIAERKISNHRFNVPDDVFDGRFRDRLELDDQTGTLTITHTTTEHTGVYELLIIRPGKDSVKKFRVSVFDEPDDIKRVSVKEGEPVKLETDIDDIQTFEEILWRFGLFTLLAEIRGRTNISPLEDRVDLDDKTGSLTIKNSRPTDAGVYMLCKIEGGKITTNLYRVEVDPTDNRINPVEESLIINNPEEVPLMTIVP